MENKRKKKREKKTPLVRKMTVEEFSNSKSVISWIANGSIVQLNYQSTRVKIELKVFLFLKIPILVFLVHLTFISISIQY